MTFIVIGMFVAVAACWDILAAAVKPYNVPMFLKHHGTGDRFANREEDMGEPGLREAKESYNPTMMLEKYQMEIL